MSLHLSKCHIVGNHMSWLILPGLLCQFVEMPDNPYPGHDLMLNFKIIEEYYYFFMEWYKKIHASYR